MILFTWRVTDRSLEELNVQLVTMCNDLVSLVNCEKMIYICFVSLNREIFSKLYLNLASYIFKPD